MSSFQNKFGSEVFKIASILLRYKQQGNMHSRENSIENIHHT